MFFLRVRCTGRVYWFEAYDGKSPKGEQQHIATLVGYIAEVTCECKKRREGSPEGQIPLNKHIRLWVVSGYYGPH